MTAICTFASNDIFPTAVSQPLSMRFVVRLSCYILVLFNADLNLISLISSQFSVQRLRFPIKPKESVRPWFAQQLLRTLAGAANLAAELPKAGSLFEEFAASQLSALEAMLSSTPCFDHDDASSIAAAITCATWIEKPTKDSLKHERLKHSNHS